MTIATPSQSLDVTLTQHVGKYLRASKAKATVKGYRSDLAHFAAFCSELNVPALPSSPGTIAVYLTTMAESGLKAATMSRRLAAISKAHSAAQLDSPTSMKNAVVKEVWAGIKRTVGTAQTAKAAATVEYLKSMLEHAPGTLMGLRDRALLVIGFAAALRRSELVALTVADMQYVPEGLVLTIRGSKTDQEKAGQKVAIALGSTPETCAVHSLRAWLLAAGISVGPVFRAVDRWQRVREQGLNDRSVALIVKRYAKLSGFDPAVFAGHSLRAGLATSAALAGATERTIMRQTRHRSEAMVRRYIRDGNLFKQNVSALVGL